MVRRSLKPLDAGTGRVCASFDPASATWLSIGAPHDGHGFIELADHPPFDEADRGDPAATRQHRARLADPAHAFLAVEIDGDRPRLEPLTDDPRAPAWRGDGIRVATIVGSDANAIAQAWEVRRGTAVTIRLRGCLDRPALAEITETDPPRPTGARTVRRLDGNAALLEAALLPARAEVTLDGVDATWTDAGADGVIARLARSTVHDPLTWVLTVRLEPVVEPVTDDPLPASATGDRIVDRALAYVRGCTALRTRSDERTILTDHRLLPLSWTRDGYWQALALLAADGPGDRERVAEHLRWLWRRCDRPQGWWARSHHADGRRKDLAFQADQQLYPMLELADYRDVAGSLPDGVSWPRAVSEAWDAAETRVDDALGLLASGENAADDPAAAPFIGASQILRWRAARLLEAMASDGTLDLDPETFAAAAQAARTAFDAAFHRGDAPWPYAVDARGRPEEYHDANDLPVALAPAWGFCPADDRGWRATMAFAFSPANPGWVAGRHPGLGSAHTDGVWTLGDVQAWIHARTVGDDRAAADALERLERIAFADGMLPEAYDPDDETPIRHWFAWPGAALAALRLLDGSPHHGPRTPG